MCEIRSRKLAGCEARLRAQPPEAAGLTSTSPLWPHRKRAFRGIAAKFYGELCDFLEIQPIDVGQANVRVNAAATRRDVMQTTRSGQFLMRLMTLPGAFLPSSWRRSYRTKLLDRPDLELTTADRKMLVEYYRADTLRLSELLHWDLAQWLKA